MTTLAGGAAPLGTARVRCKDGDHTLELMEREVVAQRLLKTSRKHSFDPDTEIDWDVPVDNGQYFLPPTLISLYETPLWDRLGEEERIELSKRETASLASFGITAELALMGTLVGHATATGYQTSHWAYALTEIEDECRHSKMFARLITTLGYRPTPQPWWYRGAVRLAPLVPDPLRIFAAALVVEEYTDAVQRVAMADEDVHPIMRAVSRIHVIEEARHIKYAREELKRQVVRRSPARRRLAAFEIARLGSRLLSLAVHPSCYEAVGLDPKVARKAVRESPHRRQTEQWLMRRCMGFFGEVGFLDGRAAGVWAKSGMLAPATAAR